MDIKGVGYEAHVSAEEQSDQWLLDAAIEIREAAENRGLELPNFVGNMAIKAIEEPILIESGIEIMNSIHFHMESTVEGYYSIVNALENMQTGKYLGLSKKENARVFTEKFDNWLTVEKISLLKHMKETQPDIDFTLVATPNIVIDSADIVSMAKYFFQCQSSTSEWEELYSRYTAEQLSGVDINSPSAVNFLVVPSKANLELAGPISEQRALLLKLQLEHDSLKVPSVMQSMSYWATLESQGMFRGYDVMSEDTTSIIHFDLPEYSGSDIASRVVPYSYINSYGTRNLDIISSLCRHNARLAVG